MEQFRFAFLIMSADHDSSKDHRQIETPLCKSIIIGVKDIKKKELKSSKNILKIKSLQDTCRIYKIFNDSSQNHHRDQIG